MSQSKDNLLTIPTTAFFDLLGDLYLRTSGSNKLSFDWDNNSRNRTIIPLNISVIRSNWSKGQVKG